MKQTPYLFLLPSILFLAFTSLYPICYSIYYSFFNWRWGDEKDFIVANGTSCRHQISDLSEKKGKHVSELLFKIFETVN